MVTDNLSSEEVKITGQKFNHGGSQKLGFSREPSFSGWFDEDGTFHSDYQLESTDESVEDFHFELPSARHSGVDRGNLETERDQYKELQQRSKLLNSGMTKEGTSTDCVRHGSGNYMPFDVENGSGSSQSFLSNGANGTFNSMETHGASHPKSGHAISAADVLKTLFFILVWYTFSTFLTLYNKTLLGDDLGKFPAPLLMNTIHFAMQAVLSNAITCFWSNRFRPSVPVSWGDYFFRVVPTALATALDVNLSNVSLVFVSVTFATMCKSASPIFLLLFAFAFRLESPSIKLLGIIFVISVGILLTVAKETEFELWGFIFIMLAAVMSGFRWTMTQILLQKEVYGLKNPLTLMSYVTPVMAGATFLLSLIMDPWDKFKKNNYFNSSWHLVRSSLLMLLGGSLAFFMVLTEYILVSVTSAVTVTIAGVVKEAVTILVAVLYFHDQFTWLKGVGLITIMLGVSLFNWYKYQKLQKGKLDEEIAAGSLATNSAAKYVILEDMQDPDDGLCEPSILTEYDE